MKSIKKSIFCAAVLLCCMSFAVSPAKAQETTPPAQNGQMQGPPAGGPGGRRMGPDRRLEMMQRELQLSEDQSAQLKVVFADQRSRMDALRSNTGIAPKDLRDQMMAIHQDTETKINAILTPEQKSKYDAMVAKMRERMQQRGSGNPPPPSSTPQQ